jgi:hypothetical protein
MNCNILDMPLNDILFLYDNTITKSTCNILDMPAKDIIFLWETIIPTPVAKPAVAKPAVAKRVRPKVAKSVVVEKPVKPKVVYMHKKSHSNPIRITPANSNNYIGHIIEYTSRNTKKNAIIKGVSSTGKTIYIKEIKLNSDMSYTEVSSHDLGNNLEVVSRKVFLKK